MYSKEILQDTGDTAAHMNRGNAQQMQKRRSEPQVGRQTACVTGTQQGEGRAEATWSSHV